MGNWRTLIWAVSILGFLLTLDLKNDATAEVQVDVNIGFPPPFVFHAPPPVVVIPGTYVYMVPDIDARVLFYRGHWYRPHGERWLRAHRYDGPWMHVVPRHVPHALMKLPRHYHSLPPGHHRISHGELKANWGKWERKKHWHNDKEWKAGWKGYEGNGGSEQKHARERQGKHSENKGYNGKSDREWGREKHGKH